MPAGQRDDHDDDPIRRSLPFAGSCCREPVRAALGTGGSWPPGSTCGNHRRLHESLQNVTPADVYEGAAGGDLGPACADQTRDAGTATAVEAERGMTTATRRECDLLTSPNGPEDSDDLQH